jgi:hypothetical protein
MTVSDKRGAVVPSTYHATGAHTTLGTAKPSKAMAFTP